MKRVAAFFVALISFLVLVTATAEGTDWIEIKNQDDGKIIRLSIKEYGLSADHSYYSVKVSGYNALLSGKSGKISDIMPFEIAIAWNPIKYMICNSFELTTDPVTIAIFQNEDGTPMEEPVSIMIVRKGVSFSQSGYCYIYNLEEGKFHRSDEPGTLFTKEAVSLQDYSDNTVNVGDYVSFGHFPQTYEGEDNSPIEWVVLDIRDGKALLLSRYALEYLQYHTEKANITYEQCSLRNWLNNDFLNMAFNESERSAILLTEVNNVDAQARSDWKNTIGGNNTLDYVFLLGYKEAQLISPDDAKLCNKTEYAKSHIRASDNAWWLRNPGSQQNTAALISTYGRTNRDPVNNSHLVRPAIWVDLGSDAF